MQGTTQAHIWYGNMNKCTTQIKERGLRVNRSNTNKKMCFEVRAPSSTSPPSPRRISNPLGVPNSSFNQYNLYRGNTNGLLKTGVPNSTNTTSTEAIQKVYRRPEYRTPPNPPLPKRDTSTIHLYRRGIQIPTNSTSLRGSKPQSQPLPKREQPTTQIHLYQRGISK